MATAERSSAGLEVAAKRRQVVDLRLAGHTFDDIAAKTGLAGHSSVRYHLDAWLAEQKPSSEQTEELRQVQAAQIDAMAERLWPNRDDVAVVDRLVKLMDRKARLMGLDLQANVSVVVLTRESLAAALWSADDVVDVEPVEVTDGGE